MIFLHQHDSSVWQKCLIATVFVAAILASGKLMFADERQLSSSLESYRIHGDYLRRIIIVFCSIAYLLRLLITLFVFLRRKLTWVEAATISIVMPSILIAFAYVGGNKYQSLDLIDIVGLLLYLVGSYLNTRSEHLRHIWKKKMENEGRLYTEGLFKYSMHINYFGDVVLFTGLAMITHSIGMLLIPFLMALNFIIILIPLLDQHLEKKYRDEFKDYSKRTKKLIPMVY